MKKLLFAALMAISIPSLAGKFEIIGEGTASKAAEFIRINITVESECHTTALSARQVVDQLTQDAVVVLEKYKTNIPGQLSISPEANLQRIKTAYIGNQNIVICDEAHSWTSSTVVQFKLDSLQKLAELQDALLKLNIPSLPVSDINRERLTLSLSKPMPGVLANTWDEMSDLALQRAHQNALRQVKVLSMGMSNPKVELSKVSVTTTSSGQALYDRVDSEGDTSGVSLGTVSLKLSREFTFKVEAQ